MNVQIIVSYVVFNLSWQFCQSSAANDILAGPGYVR